MTTPSGRCPACDSRGEVGEGCGERGCTRQGYHFVPEEYLGHGSGPMVDPMAGRMVGRFLLVQAIGSGAFGKVYLGLQGPRYVLRAAVKLLDTSNMRSAMVSRVLEKFVKEADALALLDHPNIVRFLDQGEHRGQAYLAMEYVAGAQTLGEELEVRRRRGAEPVLTPAEVRAVLLPLCHALSSAHDAGVIHRDIKPDNIILQRVEGNPLFVRVVDFGLAKFADEGTATSMLSGTPVYMAPEQLERRHLGPWTDVYAVGMLAMELLTGCEPYAGHTPEQVFKKKLDPAFDPTELAGATAPLVAAALLRGALAARPEDRYQDVAAFRGELEAVLDALETGAPGGGAGAGGVQQTVATCAEAPPTAADADLGLSSTIAGSEVAAEPPATSVGTAVLGETEFLQMASGGGPQPDPAQVAAAAGRSPSVPTTVAVTPAEAAGAPAPRRLRMVPWLVAASGVLCAVVAVILWQWGDDRELPPPKDDSVRVHGGQQPDARPDTRRLDLSPDKSPAERVGLQWLTIPGGSFMMGSKTGDKDEKRVHRVTVSTFRMSKTEVTVAQYRSCMKAGACSSHHLEGYEYPGQKYTKSKYCNWSHAGRGAHPMNCIDWKQARAFCRWAGGRLASEAEWEYAARSGGKSWKYPWGDEAATCSRAVMDDGKTKGSAGNNTNGCGEDRTWSVCSKTAGNTVQGLCDMAGNVWEWTEDCWHGSYRGAPSDGSAWTQNCSASGRVVRGGGWLLTGGDLRAASRSFDPPGHRYSSLGVRCAR